MIGRIIFTVVLVIGIFLVPWWLVIIGALCGMFLFPTYLDGVIPFILVDIFYSVPQVGFFTFQFLFTIVGLLALIAIEYIKERLLVYN